MAFREYWQEYPEWNNPFSRIKAMFWAGLRRSEIWGLEVEDIDWQTPKLNICHARKQIASKKYRKLGDPKWHKIREAPFPEDLQKAVKKLWAVNGVHDFVFCRKDGTQPEPDSKLDPHCVTKARERR
ncbi:MAG: tyrosine-type recombinase/integrase [Treponema sp.]|jgi:integrase|nr:tyrosine-type recombinase/integrase [Treponema sp.]